MDRRDAEAHCLLCYQLPTSNIPRAARIVRRQKRIRQGSSQGTYLVHWKFVCEILSTTIRLELGLATVVCINTSTLPWTVGPIA